MKLRFEPLDVPGTASAFIAQRGQWQFLIIHMDGAWTTSYRLIDPKRPVSGSSTIRGPFDTFDEARDAAEDMRRELRALS